MEEQPYRSPLEVLLDIAVENNQPIKPYVIEYLSMLRHGYSKNFSLGIITAKYLPQPEYKYGVPEDV